MRSPGRARIPLLRALLPAAVLAAELCVVSVRATPVRHEGAALLALGLLYFLLALSLHLAARYAWRSSRIAGALVALLVGAVPAMQARWDAERFVTPTSFAAATCAFALVYLCLLAWSAPRRGDERAPARELLLSYGALFLLAGLAWTAFRGPAALRWHLLVHHRLLGTPLHRLGSRPVPVERAALWERREPLSEPWEHAREVALLAPPRSGTRTSPHVVFLLIDTLRADALEAWGGKHEIMPATNELAARSFVFGDVRANASWTRASCASIFTGLLPEEHGAARFHESLAEEWSTLPEVMRASGYQTAAFVSNWLHVGRQTGFAQGFDDAFFELTTPGQTSGREEHELRSAYARAGEVNRALFAWLASEQRIRAAERGAPLFLYLHYLDPHAPYLEPVEPGTEDDPRERRRGLYRQQLRYLDRHLAELFSGLESALPGPKVIVLTSDHGEEFGEHDGWGHGHTLYDELVHVPLVVSLPGGEAGRIDSPLELRDLYRLVPALARPGGVDLRAWGRQHARSLRYASQYLDRDDAARPDKKWTALRRIEDARFELIWSGFGPTLELYDRASDPQELDNRIDREPEPAAQLSKSLEEAVRFWTRSPFVVRSERDLAFLRALGYAGGSAREPVQEP